MSGAAPLVAAKLLPPSPGRFHLDRPRLLERLRHGLDARAGAILAGPGYGKTALAARFLRDLADDSVWLQLDGSDRDAALFFRYLREGLRQHVAEFGEHSEDAWHDLRGRDDEAERLADVFIRDAEESLGGRVVLVVDGLHHLAEGGAVHRALRRLIAYLPGALHLILIGRSLPDVGFAPLMADGSAHMLQGEDLRFSLEETRELLQSTFGLPLEEAAIARVHQRARGWATALQLLRQTARLTAGAVDLPEEVFARTEREILDHFSAEVLAGETDAVRTFLLDASPLAVIDPEVCEEVLPHVPARALLRALLQRGLFLSALDSRGELCAFDPLFREFLRRELHARGGAEERDLEARYGRALARRGDLSGALEHLRRSGDAAAVADLLSHHGKPLLRGGMLDAVRDAARFLLRQGARSPLAEDLLGEACRIAGDHAAAVRHFEACLAAGERSGAALASTLQGLAYSLLKIGEGGRAAETAERALAAAGDADPELAARVLNTLSIVRYRQDRLSEAVDGWQQALARARQAGDQHLIRMIAHNLGLPHAALGDFRRAADCFQILTQPDNPRLGPEEGAAYLNLARIETIRGEPARAAALLGDAREIAMKWGLEGLQADVLEAEGTLLRETGDLEAARERYRRARALLTGLGQTDLLLGLDEEEALLAARRGDLGEAGRLATDLVSRRRAAGAAEGLAASLLAAGEIRLRAGEAGPATEALEEAARGFGALGRAYQECLARLWLAAARLRAGDAAAAEREAGAALALADRFDYRGAVLRVAAAEPAFRRLLATLHDAPAYLEQAAEPRAVTQQARRLPPGDAPDLTVRMLGPIEVYRDPDRPIPARAWKIRRALQIFCLLASSRDRRATKDRIVDALFGETRLSVIEKNFHPTISFLRRALNHDHNVPKNFVLFERGAYRLNPSYRYFIDIDAFEARLREARTRAARGDAAGAIGDFEAGLALYRGPFLDEEYEDWVEPVRARLEALRRQALKDAAELHLRAGDRDAGLVHLRRLVDLEPLDEEGSARLMRALGAAGNRAGVEREWRRLQKVLEDELEATPLPETVRAYQDALSVDPPDGAGGAAGGPGV